MNFYTDRQTIDDLNIFGKRGGASVYAIFNRTSTKQGADQLEYMFRHPLSNITQINSRILTIRLFMEHPWEVLKNHEIFDAATVYLSLRDNRSRLNHEDNKLSNTIRAAISADGDLLLIRKGIHAFTELLQQLKSFLQQMENILPADHPWQSDCQHMRKILDLPDLQPVFSANAKKIPFEIQVQLDQLLRFRCQEEMGKLLYYCAMMDVYISVGQLAKTRGFVFPEPVMNHENLLQLTDVFHPELQHPIPNSVTLSEEQNLLFLTGANMAGKSTFMKSVGIAVYLAHMGFPVPAAGMRFSVRAGILSTINLSDNLGMGFSHFYAEVVRVKKVAEALKKGLSMFVLIDELFRGTNVKDAHDATIAVAGGFTRKMNSAFVISTHIMEAGEVLQKQYPQISFQFLPTRMEGNVPVYPRKLEAGISADRHGMIIIHNEGIIDMLNKAARAIHPPQKAHHALSC